MYLKSVKDACRVPIIVAIIVLDFNVLNLSLGLATISDKLQNC